MSTRPCPCGLPEPIEACCGRYLDAGPADRPGHAPGAPTAEALMRSRFTAFALGDAGYLRATWHPDTRPSTLDLDPARRWLRLEILDRAAGGLFDREGVVEFRAHHRDGDRPGVLHERSRFARVAGRWRYLDGDLRGTGTGRRR